MITDFNCQLRLFGHYLACRSFHVFMLCLFATTDAKHLMCKCKPQRELGDFMILEIILNSALFVLLDREMR